MRFCGFSFVKLYVFWGFWGVWVLGFWGFWGFRVLGWAEGVILDLSRALGMEKRPSSLESRRFGVEKTRITRGFRGLGV